MPATTPKPAQAEAPGLLEVMDLQITAVKQNKVLAGPVNFRLDRSESLGIVGESGSGKTITALSLMQLLPAGLGISGGSIRYHGVDLAARDEKQMTAYRGRHLAMIFQEPMSSLNPSMKCGHQVREAVSLHQEGSAGYMKDQVLHLFNETELPSVREIYELYPHQLSGGQRQRVMIAMALAGNPALLIADEPTTALDVTVQRRILDLLQRIRQDRKMSMLFISHDLGVIRRVCERSMVMYRGSVVETAPVEQLFSEPEDAYTRGLIACRPQHHPKGRALPTLDDFREQEESGRQDKHIVEDSRTGVSATTEPLLSVEDLVITYTLRKDLLGRERRALTAVDHVSFTLYRGETLGLIGGSGCGKSTLGKTLVGLIRSRNGKIRYHGSGRVQYIFQDPYASLNPALRVGHAIGEVMRVHGLYAGKKERRMATLALLEEVGLAREHFGRYPHEFSGGQRQRIGLARALAARPELLILDESVSSLDVSVQARILNLLNELKSKMNLSYLFISHDLAVVRYMADRILVMKDGGLVEEGTAENLYHAPSHAYTRELIRAVLD